MSNEHCGPCAEGDHGDCVWAAGSCPECGPSGCLSSTPVGVRPVQSYWEPGPESFSEDDRDQTARELTEAQKLAIDMSVTGSAWIDGDGKRVAPEDVTVLHVDVAKDGAIGIASASQDADGNTVVRAGAWEPGPESWPGTESLDDVIRRVLPPPEEYAEQAQQLRNEQYAKAGLPMPGTAAKGVLRHLLGSGRRPFDIQLTTYGAVGNIGNAIHAAMEAERSEAIEQALAPGALPEPFGALNLTEWTAAMLADWQDATITSAELLTLLDEMLDRTLHSDACHIDPDDTTCFCVIGQLRSVLPPCTVEYPLVPGDAKLWHCTRKAHPASPERHVWSNR